MSKEQFLKGTLILTCTGLLCRLAGFFYRIFLSHTIGAQGVGIYQLSLPLSALLLAMTAFGMQAVISRGCASLQALGKDQQAKDTFLLGTGICMFLSVGISFILYKNAVFIAVRILKEPATLPLICLMSFCFPLSALHTCVSSYYYSMKQALTPSCIQLFEQAVRIGSSYLVYLILLSEKKPATPLLAGIGALCGEIAACLSSLLTLGIHFQKTSYKIRFIHKPFASICRLFWESVPHTLNKVLLTLLGSIEVVLIPGQLQAYGLSRTDALGVYGVFTGMTLPLLLFPSALTTSAAVMLMPSIVQLQALGNRKRISYVVRSSCMGCLFLGCICALFFLFFGHFAGVFLFNSITAGNYITSLAFICPFLYMNTAMVSILNGLGKASRCLFHNMSGALLRILFVIFAIPAMGIRGYFYGMLSGELLLSLLHLIALIRYFTHLQQASASRLQ